jgi:hypothetical protein
VTANGVGVLAVVQTGTWEGARALFAVALVYGLVVLIALPAQLIFGEADDVLWWYVVADAAFLGPIAPLFVRNERRTKDSRG